jgi:glycosyltransferase involved in cell wall biosynthesis
MCYRNMREPTAASPRVTVIIPTYNWSSVLPYSIGSVLRQSFSDFELLVVGDGCTDDSEQIVTAIADRRLRWIHLPVNTGHQSTPNNEGLRRALGSIIAYLGHDDLWLPHHLEVMISAIDAGADVAHSIVHMIGAEGDITPPAGGMLGYQPGQWMPPTGVVHRRIAAEKIGGWRDYRSLSTDPESDFFHRMHQAGFAFQSVCRLTAVKFPASWRKDSYRKRSSREQQQWTDRILKENDLEAVETGKLLVATELERCRQLVASELELRRQLTFRAGVRTVLARTSNRIRGYLPGKKTLRWATSWVPPTMEPAKGAMVRERRQFKGL